MEKFFLAESAIDPTALGFHDLKGISSESDRLSMYKAAVDGDSGVAMKLLKRDPSLACHQPITETGDRALHVAVYKKRTKLVRDLVARVKPSDLELHDGRGYSACCYAATLSYLHSASFMPIYHRDIKSSNILLDEKFVVKVSDFRTSRSIATDQTHLTTMVKGTFGYLDPEYFQSSQFTKKSDVYSFGVVLVELLTGQRPISLDKTENDRSLATRFLTSMERNLLDTILDP